MIKYRMVRLGNPKDMTKPRKVYAKSMATEVLSADDFVYKAMAVNSMFPPGVIKGVLAQVGAALAERLLSGCRVHLGELGTFSTQLKCEGADSEAHFTTGNIKAVSIVFTPSRYMMQKMAEARFAPAVTYHP